MIKSVEKIIDIQPTDQGLPLLPRHPSVSGQKILESRLDHHSYAVSSVATGTSLRHEKVYLIYSTGYAWGDLPGRTNRAFADLPVSKGA